MPQVSAPFIFMITLFWSLFAYTWGVKILDTYLDDQLSRGRGYLVMAEAMKALEQSPTAFTAAAARLIRKRRLVHPKRSEGEEVDRDEGDGEDGGGEEVGHGESAGGLS